MVFYLKGGSDGFVATSVGVRERPRGGGGWDYVCVWWREKAGTVNDGLEDVRGGL